MHWGMMHEWIDTIQLVWFRKICLQTTNFRVRAWNPYQTVINCQHEKQKTSAEPSKKKPVKNVNHDSVQKTLNLHNI